MKNSYDAATGNDESIMLLYRTVNKTFVQCSTVQGGEEEEMSTEDDGMDGARRPR